VQKKTGTREESWLSVVLKRPTSDYDSQLLYTARLDTTYFSNIRLHRAHFIPLQFSALQILFTNLQLQQPYSTTVKWHQTLHSNITECRYQHVTRYWILFSDYGALCKADAIIFRGIRAYFWNMNQIFVALLRAEQALRKKWELNNCLEIICNIHFLTNNFSMPLAWKVHLVEGNLWFSLWHLKLCPQSKESSCTIQVDANQWCKSIWTINENRKQKTLCVINKFRLYDERQVLIKPQNITGYYFGFNHTPLHACI